MDAVRIMHAAAAIVKSIPFLIPLISSASPNKICNAPGKYKFDPGYIDYLLVKSKSNGGDWDVV
jgi:hypothetical protein